MKHIVVSLMLLTFSSATNYWDQTDDKSYFKQRDNKAHLLVGAAIGAGITYQMQENMDIDPTIAWLTGVGVATLVGIAKESGDSHFDNQDVTGYALGSAISSTLIVWTF